MLTSISVLMFNPCMPRASRQVQEKKRLAEAKALLDAMTLTFPSRTTFSLPQSKRPKRQYPGDAEGLYVAAYLEYLSAFPTQQRTVLGWLRPMQKMRPKKTERAIERMKPSERVPFKRLIPFAQSPYGSYEHSAFTAALALWNLGRLHRIKECLQCGSWFYARFTHQLFCNVPDRQCRWKHFHTPEWRKKQASYRKRHRTENRKHQREYRKRLFSKGGS